MKVNMKVQQVTTEDFKSTFIYFSSKLSSYHDVIKIKGATKKVDRDEEDDAIKCSRVEEHLSKKEFVILFANEMVSI